MKLSEVFDTKRKTTIGNSELSDRTDLTGTKNGGVFSHVVPDVDPHMVNKISHRHDPAYNRYVNFLVSSKLAQQNPHFPRIYEDKTYISTKTGNKKVWKMEKLPFTYLQYTVVRQDYELSLTRMEHIANMYLVPEWASLFENVRREKDKWEQDHQIIQLSIKLFSFLKKPDDIILDSYKEALQVILKNATGRLDIHDENIMVRTTAQGPQLVFTDPYAS